ncbi:MAG: hypothetical protein KC656_33105, partial [Myxococcales bacterium]|nr:hypothetical protein [Myxococcales bacterium]
MHRALPWTLAFALAGCATTDDGVTPVPGSDDIPGGDVGLNPGQVEVELPTTAEPFGTAPGKRTAHPLVGVRGTSGGVVVHPDLDVAYMVDQDNGALERITLATDERSSFPVGDWPSRIVRVGDELFVTLRGAGELVRLKDTGSALVEVDRVKVGAEPTDVAVATEANRLYVALSQQDELLALDAATLEPVGRITLPGEPSWLATTSETIDEQELLVVAFSRLPSVARLTVGEAAIAIDWLGLPVRDRFRSASRPDVQLSRRVTGAP